MKKQTFATLMILVSCISAYAYGPIDGSAPYAAAPVDGGVSLLLLAGAAGYGMKKVRERKQRIKDAETLNGK